MNRAVSLPLNTATFDSSLAATSTPQPRPQVALHQRLILWLSNRVGTIQLDRPLASRYGTALVALLVATAVRQLLDGHLQTRAPYGIYLIAVMFVAWRAGWGPSLLTLACGVVLGRYLFDAPRYSLIFESEASKSSLLMSLTIGLVSIYFCESLRMTARMNRRLYEAARLADMRKDEFLATVAHELRNPLMPIRTAIHLLGREEQPSPRNAELQGMLSRHTEHLIRLVDDLLDASRITQGKIELRPEVVRLGGVLEAAMEVVRPLIAEKRQDLFVNLPEQQVNLRADGVRLTQVFTNLLHNAAKYTSKDGRIWLTASVNGEKLVVRIRDTGIGIPPEMCQRVFDPFQQVHQGIEHTQGGLGIGLTLVRSLVDLHQGTVTAASPGLGLGSEFTVCLPVVESIVVDPEVVTNVPAAAVHGPARRILVVDDSPSVRKSLEMILHDWDHVVQACADGFAALEEVRAFRPDVVLTDLSMPRMNGFQLAQELRRLPESKEAMLIAISGYGQEADFQQSQAAGFDCHLTKPVDLTALKNLLLKSSAQDRRAVTAGEG